MGTSGSVRRAWSPLGYSLFRALWIASVASNIGTWMHTVGASWLMTTLATSPLLVALVQTATTLPVFLLSVPAGAVADLVDRRRVLLFTQTWMLAAAATLGILTMTGHIGPWWLLALTFALGLGATMNGPAWAAAIAGLVPRSELPAAVSLNSVGFNIARAVGPALGGLIMGFSNAGVVFLLNGASFLGVIVVLWRWRIYPSAQTRTEESLSAAMRTGFRYIYDAPPYHAILIRVGLFSLGGSALWALLPIVARNELGSTETGYGILLGCLGTGSVIGAAILAPLRSRYVPDQLVASGVVLFAAASVGLIMLRHFVPVAVTMLLGGVAWMTVMSTFNVCAQMQPPPWIRARAISYYMLVFQGSLAVGSAGWGALAHRFGLRAALLSAAALMVAGLGATFRLSLGDTMNEEPTTETANV